MENCIGDNLILYRRLRKVKPLSKTSLRILRFLRVCLYKQAIGDLLKIGTEVFRVQIRVFIAKISKMFDARSGKILYVG